MSKKNILDYIKFNLIFFLFHFITWKLFLAINISYVFILISQYFIFSLTLLFFRKTELYIVFVSFPLIILYLVSVISFIDRSLTVAMLLIYFENDFQSIFIEDLYRIDEFKGLYLLDKRINEQVNSGLINVDKKSIEVTPIGKVFSTLYKFLYNIYS